MRKTTEAVEVEEIGSEKAHKDEFIEHYKKQLDEKNKELEKAIRGKEVAEQKAKELQHAAEESTRAAVSASSRADMLQKERDALEELIAHSDQNYTSLLAEFRWLAKFVRKTTEAVEVEEIDSEKAHKDEFIEHYKKQLDEKNKELEKAIRGKEVAEQKAKELQHAAEESTRAAVSASSRADMLQKERDALDAKFKAVLKGNEQAARSHGKHGQSQLSKMQQGHRRTV